MTIVLLNTVGLVFNLVGVLLLFRYGMPYRTRTGGSGFLMVEQKDSAAISLEEQHDFLGYVGLCLIILGTVLQIVANWV